MSEPALEPLRQLLLREPALQAELDRTRDGFEFAERAAQLALAHGIACDAQAILGMMSNQHSAPPAPEQQLAAPDSFDGWLPARLSWQDGLPLVEWCYLGKRRLLDSFFEQTVKPARQRALNLFVRRRSTLDLLLELAEQRPGLPLAGCVFHMSRCGSTLLAQMLAALPRHVVLSEAEPIDAVLRAHFRNPAITDEQRVAWLRATVSALGRARNPDERQLFVKFDSWHALDLPLIRRAFPDVPFLFAYRDPVEVIVSHARTRGSQMVPGLLEPELFGFDPASVVQLPLDLDGYCARVLGRICEAAVSHQPEVGLHVLPYHALPTAAYGVLERRFGLALAEPDLAAMGEATQRHAKNTSFLFVPDAVAKQQAATPHMHSLAATLVAPWYARLEALWALDG